MMENCSKAYREVIELLKYFPEEKVEKIPTEILALFESKKDLEYEYKIDESKEFNEQVMLDETKAIFANIFKEYWANEEQREIIDKIQQKEMDNVQRQEVKEQNTLNMNETCDLEDNTEIVEKEKETISKNVSNDERTKFNKCTQIMIVKKENLFIKIFNFIKELFGKSMFLSKLNFKQNKKKI